tara:strand:- start:1573 stop:1758 length:186 start_codon:yes stop_codon:yes gene_type:complete
MGKVKDWMMDMQEEADFALRDGVTSSGEVILSMRKAGLHNIDEKWVREYVEEVLGVEHDES